MPGVTPPTDRQDPNVDLDDEAKQLKLRQAKAESRKAIAEAERATLASALPNPKVVAQGKADIGQNAGYLAELASYYALDGAAAQIGAALASRLGEEPVVALVADADLITAGWMAAQVISALDTFEKAVTAAQTAVNSLSPISGAGGGHQGPAPAATPGAAAAVPAVAIGAVADVFGLFRSDYAFTARIIAKDPPALTTAVLTALQSHGGLTVIVDGMRLLADEDSVLTRLNKLRAARDELAALRTARGASVSEPAKRRIADFTDEITDLQRSAPADAALPADAMTRIATVRTQRRVLSDALAPAAALLAEAEQLLTRIDAFLNEVTAVPAGGGYPPALGAALQNRATQDGRKATHLLHLRLSSMGGEVITRRWLFSTSIKFLGGAAVSYTVLDVATGKLLGGSAAATTSVRYSTWLNRIGNITTSALRPSAQ
jgi:hypothetical protein